jgi:hypothetical protein
MRRLKHKHTRRAVQFYEINHGFRKPFKAGHYVLHTRQHAQSCTPSFVCSTI